MREIKLYGHLGRRFGKLFRLDVNSVAEAVSALRANLPGFDAHMLKHSAPGYHILVDNRGLGADELMHPCGRGTIKFIPAVQGSKSAGVFQTILGAVVTAVGYFVPGAQMLIPAGLSMMAGGVITLLTRSPTKSSQEKPENTPNYAFNGPINTTAQGNPVPVCYGEMMVGSQVVSMGLSVGGSLVAAASANSGSGTPGSTSGPGIPTAGLSTTITSVSRTGHEGSWNYDNAEFYVAIQIDRKGALLNTNAYVYNLLWESGREGDTGQFNSRPYDDVKDAFHFTGNVNSNVGGMRVGDRIFITATARNNWAVPSEDANIVNNPV